VGWWSLSGWPEAVMGDGSADLAGNGLAELGAARARAGRPAPRYEDVLEALAAAIAAGARENIAVPPHCKFEGLVASFEGGNEIRAASGAGAPADEVKPLRAMLKALRSEYKSSELNRKPMMREVLESVSFVLGPLPNRYVDAAETRVLTDITALFRDERGVLGLDAYLPALAVAFRRHGPKLGDIIEDGGLMKVTDLVATVQGGAPIRISCATVKADSFVVDELSELLKGAATFYRDGFSRLPTMDEIVAEVTRALRRHPERYDTSALTDLNVSFTLAPQSGRSSNASSAPLRVRHPKFGEGHVIRVIEDTEKKYEIHFSQGGKKTLLARFVEIVPPSGS
jgi:hypothetical protein